MACWCPFEKRDAKGVKLAKASEKIVFRVLFFVFLLLLLLLLLLLNGFIFCFFGKLLLFCQEQEQEQLPKPAKDKPIKPGKSKQKDPRPLSPKDKCPKDPKDKDNDSNKFVLLFGLFFSSVVAMGLVCFKLTIECIDLIRYVFGFFAVVVFSSFFILLLFCSPSSGCGEKVDIKTRSLSDKRIKLPKFKVININVRECRGLRLGWLRRRANVNKLAVVRAGKIDLSKVLSADYPIDCTDGLSGLVFCHKF
jgi:hypothetical protein